MDKERETLLFGHRDEKLNKALETFGKTKNDVDQDMQIIKEWLETQKHFPETPRDEILINMLILNKFSIENLKKHLDMYYTLRSILMEVFVNKDYKSSHMQLAHNTLCYVPLPKLTKEGYRVTVTNLMTASVDEYEPYDLAASLGHYVEVRLIKDIMVGEIYIADLKPYSLAHMGKLTPMVVKKIFTAGERVYKNIVKQIHFINAPSYIEGIISLVKQIVSPKIADRIHAHKSFETLTTYIPVEILPKEYGGPDYTLNELRQMWKEELQANHQRLEELNDLRTDESKRPEPLENDDILGFYGNFKKLNVD